MSVHAVVTTRDLGKVFNCAFAKLVAPVWCPESFVENFFPDPEAQMALDGPYNPKKRKIKQDEPPVKVGESETPETGPVIQPEQKIEKKIEEKKEAKNEQEDLTTDDKPYVYKEPDEPEKKTWMNYIYGRLQMRHKQDLEDCSWLGDIHIRVVMRLIEENPPGGLYLQNGQDPVLTCDSEGNSSYSEARSNTLQCLHGVTQGHWAACCNFYPVPVFVEPYNKIPKMSFRKHLMALYPPKDGATVIQRLNTYKQPDGWSCGYRALAYMWHMARGDKLEDVANLYFDSKKLAPWLISCLEKRKVTAPPVDEAPPNAKRVLGDKVALVVEYRVTEKSCKSYVV